MALVLGQVVASAQHDADGGTGLIGPVGPLFEPPSGTENLDHLRDTLVGSGSLEDVRRDWPPGEGAEPIGWGPPPSGWTMFVDSRVEAAFDADVDGTDANEVNSTRFGLGGGWQRFGAGGSFQRLRYGYEFSVYDFSGDAPLAGGSEKPIEDLAQNQISYTYVSPMEGRSNGFAGIVNLRSGTETSADFGDSLSYQVIGGWRVRGGEDLIWNFGGLVQYDLSGDFTIVPVIGVDWQIRDGLRLRTPGAGLELEVDLATNARGYFSALYENRNYRLGDEGPQLLVDGSVEDESVVLRTGVRLNWASEPGGFPNRRLDFYVGAVPYRSIGFFDSADESLGDIELDPAALAGFSLQIGF